MTDQVEHIVAVSQGGADVLQSCAASRGQRGKGNAGQACPRPLHLALHVHRVQRAAIRLPIGYIGRVCDHQQGPQVSLGTKAHRPPVKATQVAREQHMLACDEMRTVLRIAQRLPPHTV